MPLQEMRNIIDKHFQENPFQLSTKTKEINRWLDGAVNCWFDDEPYKHKMKQNKRKNWFKRWLGIADTEGEYESFFGTPYMCTKAGIESQLENDAKRIVALDNRIEALEDYLKISYVGSNLDEFTPHYVKHKKSK